MHHSALVRSFRRCAHAALALALICLLAAGPAAADENPAMHPGPIQFPEVVIAYNQNNPPFKFQDDKGQAAGLLMDIWRLWAEKIATPVRFVSAPFPETVDMVRDGRANIHAGLFYTRERDGHLDFTDPLHGVEYYIVFHKSILGINAPEDLAGFRVGVPAEGYTHEFMRSYYPGTDLALYPDYPALFDAAQRGEIKVFVAPLENLRDHLRDRNLDNNYRHRQGRPLFVRQYLGAVREGEGVLLDRINKGLARITSEEMAALEEKWLGWPQSRPSSDTLVIALSDANPPFSFQDPYGRPAGLLVDLWNLWAKQTGSKVTFRLSSWADSIQAVKTGEADFHSGLIRSRSRQEFLDFSDPVYELETSLYHAPDREMDSGLAGLENVRLGVMAGSYQEEVLGELLPASSRIHAYNTIEELVYALIGGEIDAFAGETPVVNLVLTRERFAGQVAPSPEPLFTRPLRAGALKGAGALMDRINKGLAAMPQEELVRMEQRWITDEADRYFQRQASGPGSPAVILSPGERAWLEQHPLIRLGVDPGYEPFEFLTPEGNHAGVASDYVALLNKRLGANFQVMVMPTWSEVVEKAKIQEVDVLPAVMETNARREYLVFTRPYLSSPEMIFCRDDAPFMGGPEDLRGKTVALKRGSYMQDRIRQDYPGLRLALFDTTLDALQAVASGKADAYINTLAHGSYIIAKYNLSNLKVAAPMGGQVDGLTFAVRKDWPVLRDILDKGLASISPEEAAAIRAKWIAVRFEHGRAVQKILRWGGLAFGFILLIMALGFVWNRRLAREITRREEVEERLKTAKEQAESADRLKSAFLATMSHELRTPLNSIIGFSSIVLQELPGPLNEEQKKQMGMVKNSARHLLDLINDVLDISKIEAGQLTMVPEQFSLGASLGTVVGGVRPLAANKGLELALIDRCHPDSIFSDRRRVEQIIINLVNNAIKFTDRGAVTVEASGPSRLNPQGVDMMRIQVSDTGIGIKPEDIAKLFRPFRQVETGLDRKYEGTGLGLSISKRLTSLLGGKITVESEFGKGSRFTVWIPVHHQAQTE